MKLRIAPSPTGELHIGNARTALFNWLYARKHNGKFLLRIDDTDVERSTPEFQKNIIEGLEWLGIDWDEGFNKESSTSYKQSDRFDRYEKIALYLVEKGLAYEDDGAIRFKVEENKNIYFEDYIRGDMNFNTNDIEDFVILRSDKTPTYHLASTVDDIDYEISIIARGEDILSSTPKHIMIMEALDAKIPDFCHLPLLFGPDGKKLSKRHGDTSVSSFRDQGILANAMFNYMSILGWSPGDDLEIFQREVAIDNFDLKNVLPNPAIFDTVKLLWMNGQYIRNLNNDEFSKKAIDNISYSLGREIFKEELERINLILEVVQERLETLNDIIHQVKFLLDEPFTVNVDEWNSVNSENVQSYLEIIRGKFKSMEDFNLENIENMMREQLKELNMKPKEGFQATRIAVTGTNISPPLFESIFALGKSATIARLAEMIENL
ncbi:MAG: glutamate--tRNA ligase [Candidatus Actinomarina sp.]